MIGTRRWFWVSLFAVVAGLVAVPVEPAQAAGCGPVIADPLREKPWPLRRLRPELVWPLSTGEGVTVAVIDSGVSQDHPALEGQVLAGADLIQPGGSGQCDEDGHGTIIAGLIAGKQTRESGFYGIAPGAKILPVRVLKDRKRSSNEDAPIRIADAIRIATDKGADVINLSLTTAPVLALQSAVEYALSHDVVVVAAAGNVPEGQGNNEGPPPPMFPASYPGVVAVAGVDKDGNHVPSSVSGDWVDIAAPGFEISGPAPQGGGFAYEPGGGTSFAAAYVSGAVALLRAFRTDLTASAISRRVMATADRPADGWDKDIGNGVVNPYWAVSAIAEGETGVDTVKQITVPSPTPDPLLGTRVVAVLATLGSVGLSVFVLTGAWVLRRGRRRGWKPG